IFFFSSRRRHTRFSRDWSSDVCSSDLAIGGLIAQGATPVAAAVAGVFLHGAAGDLGFAEPGDTRAFRPHMAGLTAGDIARRLPRSEERRVGKQCRCRWWPY